MNRFVFIVPFRNVAPFIKECVNSLLSQKYKNWIAIFFDDASTDGSAQKIKKHPQIIVRINKERVGLLANFHNALMASDIKDDDIVCTLDGDDFFWRPDALDIINTFYKDGALLTYGQYLRGSNKIFTHYYNKKLGRCRALQEKDFNNMRGLGYFMLSHLRTFKYILYKELLKQDPQLTCFKDEYQQYLTNSGDVAIMLPLAEIAGFHNVRFNPTPVYFYRIHSNNEHATHAGIQEAVAREIYAKPKFKQVF